MGRAKDIQVKPVPRKDADRIIQSLHYSGKVVRNSQIHLGVFLDNKCGGVLQFGPSLDTKRIIGLVRDTGWNGFIELNRMALADWLPPNGESRSIAISMKLLKKHYPHLEWVVSFADGAQCGHGTIYQASGFSLTGISESKNLFRLPNGDTIHKMTLESNPMTPRPELGGKSYYDVTGGRYNLAAYVQETGGEVIPGFQFRYMYFLNPEARDRLAVPIILFSKIKEIGGEMYRGEAR